MSIFNMVINNKLMLKLPDDIQIITEGSGADVKYYAQLGADAASKKRLGRRELKSFTVPTLQNSKWVDVSLPVDDSSVVMAKSNYGDHYKPDALAVVDMITGTKIGDSDVDIEISYVNASTVSIYIHHGTGAIVYYI